jgi:hypothetical protein
VIAVLAIIPAATAPQPPSGPQLPPPPSPAGAYAVQAAFYRQQDGRETTLATGDRVTPGDTLGLRVSTSTPAYVYVANQDDDGNNFLLYPLHANTQTPLPADREHRLPVEESGHLWQVTSPGAREHFLVFVSPTKLENFDDLLRELPRAEEGRPVVTSRASREPQGQTRGVGGLATIESTRSPGLQRLFARASPLSERRETVQGEWIRELTLVNPVNPLKVANPSRSGASSQPQR